MTLWIDEIKKNYHVIVWFFLAVIVLFREQKTHKKTEHVTKKRDILSCISLQNNKIKLSFHYAKTPRNYASIILKIIFKFSRAMNKKPHLTVSVAQTVWTWPKSSYLLNNERDLSLNCFQWGYLSENLHYEREYNNHR